MKSYDKKSKQKKEAKVVKTIMLEPSLIKRVDNIHDNLSEFTRDALNYYLDKYERENICFD